MYSPDEFILFSVGSSLTALWCSVRFSENAQHLEGVQSTKVVRVREHWNYKKRLT